MHPRAQLQAPIHKRLQTSVINSDGKNEQIPMLSVILYRTLKVELMKYLNRTLGNTVNTRSNIFNV